MNGSTNSGINVDFVVCWYNCNHGGIDLLIIGSSGPRLRLVLLPPKDEPDLTDENCDLLILPLDIDPDTWPLIKPEGGEVDLKLSWAIDMYLDWTTGDEDKETAAQATFRSSTEGLPRPLNPFVDAHLTPGRVVTGELDLPFLVGDDHPFLVGEADGLPPRIMAW